MLGALPPDLRREVISQVEARKRQRQAIGGSSNTSAPYSPAIRGGPSATRGDGEQVAGAAVAAGTGAAGAGAASAASGGDAGSSPAMGASAQNMPFSADANGESGAEAVAGGPHAMEAVREGFDLTVRGGTAKVQQVGEGGR